MIRCMRDPEKEKETKKEKKTYEDGFGRREIERENRSR